MAIARVEQAIRVLQTTCISRRITAFPEYKTGSLDLLTPPLHRLHCNMRVAHTVKVLHGIAFLFAACMVCLSINLAVEITNYWHDQKGQGFTVGMSLLATKI